MCQVELTTVRYIFLSVKPKTSPIGRKIRELRERRGISAFKLSQLAGLGTNYVWQLERTGKKPDPAKLDLLLSALGLIEPERIELRRLAGIGPDLGATPEAKAARRDAWPLLLFVLVNHILVPLGQLDRFLSRLKTPAPELLRAAAAAVTIHVFTDRYGGEKPPASIVSIIDRFWSRLTANTLGKIMIVVKHRRSVAAGIRSLPLPHADPLIQAKLLWIADISDQLPDDTIAALAASLGQSSVSEATALSRLGMEFDRNFAVAFFPTLYWNVARAWPFEKLVMPFARLPIEQQRMLHLAIQDGLSLDEFDAALLGRGALGEQLAAAPPFRGAFYDESGDDDPAGSVRFGLEPHEFLVPQTYVGPPPTIDRFFDDLDRRELLFRFPFARADFGSFAAVTRGLGSFQVWREEIQAHTRDLPEAAAPVGPMFERPLVDRDRSYAFTTNVVDRCAGSPTLHRLADHLRYHAWLALRRQDWPALLTASDAIGAGVEWKTWLRDVQAHNRNQETPIV